MRDSNHRVQQQMLNLGDVIILVYEIRSMHRTNYPFSGHNCSSYISIALQSRHLHSEIQECLKFLNIWGEFWLMTSFIKTWDVTAVLPETTAPHPFNFIVIDQNWSSSTSTLPTSSLVLSND